MLKTDSENIQAHENLARIYGMLGDDEKEKRHRDLHSRYRIDNNAGELAIPEARLRYPAANHAAEALVIYDLHRESRPEQPTNRDDE